MKQTMKKIICVLAAMGLIFGFLTCGGTTPPYEMNSEAILYSLSIGEGIGEIKLEQADVPSAIHPDDYEDWSHEMFPEDFATMEFLLDSHLVNTRIRPVTSPRARVEWGIGNRATRPASYADVRVPATINANDYVYLKVTSEDTTEVNYYRVYARVFNAVTNLADVIIEGKKMSVKEGGEDWESAQEGVIHLTTIQSTAGVDIEAVGFDETSTFKFAKIAEGSTALPVFNPEIHLYFNDQDKLYIEVSAQNTIDKAYYAFLVNVARIANIEQLFIEDAKGETEVFGKGLQNKDWDALLPGSYATADEPGGGLKIRVVLEDPAADYEFTSIPKTQTTEPAFSGKPGAQTYRNLNDLAIKVTSDNGLGIMYYRIKVELLAAQFLKQPESRMYYYYYSQSDKDTNNRFGPDYVSPASFTSDTPEPITFELDRTISNATYQWYESYSWYGGYGFDQYGHLTNPNNTQAGEQDPGFVPDADHSRNFDEKMNHSLFNGGNQKAQYMVAGVPISGATGDTHTPVISDKRPFLPGYSNSAHYYWVEITDVDSGYKLTSERAVIVTERNKAVDHFVIDVNNYYYPSDYFDSTKAGQKVVFKNIVPLSYQYEAFRIPLFFPPDATPSNPDGFNITKYSKVTIQAKFYLVDGTPWIQNWTQGNAGFGNDAYDAEVEPGKRGSNVVLWHNLTNDNGMYALENVSKEPSGASLKETPTFLILEPSGDHLKIVGGVNHPQGFPPLDENGKAAASIVGQFLQGWFCGFIEVTELRFEGPPQAE